MESEVLDSGGEWLRMNGEPAADDQQEAPPQPTLAGPDENANIYSLLPKADREKLADTVMRDFEADMKSRSVRMKKLKEFTELYGALTKPHAFPFHRVANINLNVLSYTSLQVHARLFDMILPDNGKLIYSAPSSADDVGRATITEKFANSYLRNKIPELTQGLDDTLAQLVIYGSAFRRTYWDAYEQRIRSDWIPIEDFVVSHKHRKPDPSMRDVPRYTMIMHLTMADLEDLEKDGIFANVDGIDATEKDTSTNTEMDDVRRKLDGLDDVSQDSTDEDRPRLVLEQHRRCRLPNKPGVHPAFDGRFHYVVATVDKQSKRLLRVVVREEDDPEDSRRFQKEQAEFQQNQITRQAVEQELTKVQMQMQMGGPAPLQMPQMPPETPAPKPTRKRQICFFTHYRAFPSEGFYGLGFGDFIGPVNKAANALINQHVIGVTLRNARPGFISRQMRMQRGSIYVQPGELVEVDAPISAIKDGIAWMDPPLNDPTTMPLIKLLVDIADKFAGSSDIMSGSTSGANRTAKEMQILNAQLMKQITVLAKRVREALKHEFDKMWRLWGTFLPDNPEPTSIVDPMTGAPEVLDISRHMFVADARVFPAADPRMRFEKTEEANTNMAMVMQNPMLAQNPAVVRGATEEVLKANGQERLLAMLGPPPGPPQPPPPAPPWAEASDWLREKDSPVHPDDNDQEHIQSHMAFLGSPPAQVLTKNGRDMADRHIRFHEAQSIDKRASMMQQQPPMMAGPPPGPPQAIGPMPPGHGP